jgi:hypothetical protein
MYEEKFPNIDSNAKGLAVISIKDNANVFVAYPNFGYGLTVSENTRVGYLTGRFITESGINYVQVVFESEITDDEGRKYNFGCVNAKEYRTAAMGKNSSAKSLIDGLIANNKTILENNLICARIMELMTENNIPIQANHKKILYGLQSRLTSRNEKILTSPFLDAKQTGTPPELSVYSSSLQKFMNNTDISGIGVLPVIAVNIIIYVVVPLLLTAIIYLLFKDSKKESDADVVYSEDLMANLIKYLPKEVLAQLLEENKVAAAKIKDNASGQSLIRTAGYLAAGFLGFTLIDKFLANRQK